MAARGGCGAHGLDVDAQLDRLTPRQFDEWVAWSQLQSDGERRIVEILKLGFAALCAAQGHDLKPEYFDPIGEAQRKKQGRARRPARPEAEAVTPGQAATFALAVLPGAFRERD